MAKRKTVESVLDLPVAFGGVSVGDKTCRIGVTVMRSDLKVSVADKHLCDKRLSGKLVSRPPEDAPDQAAFPGMEFEDELNGVFDVKGFGVSSDSLSFGLTFNVSSVDVGSLAHFAKRGGRLIVEGVEAIPEKAKEGDEEEDDEEKEEE